MGRFVLFCLILVELLAARAMADGSGGSEANPPKIKVEAEEKSNGVLSGIAEQPVSSREESSEGEEGSGVAEAPSNRRMGKHHHSSDKSVAGGGVIIGGLVTAVFASVFCYIRVTRRRDGDQNVGVPSGGH